jgi:hypothetical protein
MTPSQKNLLLDRLSVSYNQTCTLILISKEKKLSDEMERLERRKALLKVKTDGLLHDLYHSWTGDAEALKGTIDESNKELGKCIAEIQLDMNTAGNIVKAIGYIDDVIKAADVLIA